MSRAVIAWLCLDRPDRASEAVEAGAPGCADELLGANAARIYRLEVPANEA